MKRQTFIIIFLVGIVCMSRSSINLSDLVVYKQGSTEVRVKIELDTKSELPFGTSFFWGADKKNFHSTIKSIEIRRNTQIIKVPYSVFCGVTNYGDASLQKKDALFILTIRGSDASQGYLMQIYFDDHVRKRTVMNGEFPSAREETIYSDDLYKEVWY